MRPEKVLPTSSALISSYALPSPLSRSQNFVCPKVKSSRSATQRSSRVSKAELPFKDETWAQHDLFPGGLLNTATKTLSGMTV